jgi:hypothetical protein
MSATPGEGEDLKSVELYSKELVQLVVNYTPLIETLSQMVISFIAFDSLILRTCNITIDSSDKIADVDLKPWLESIHLCQNDEFWIICPTCASVMNISPVRACITVLNMKSVMHGRYKSLLAVTSSAKFTTFLLEFYSKFPFAHDNCFHFRENFFIVGNAVVSELMQGFGPF